MRIPIGYFDLGEGLIRDTPFEPYHYIYDNAWDQIQQLVTRLRARSIGVLIDLHALPGGANAQEHSGTNSGEAQLWYSAKEQKRWIRCCQILAERVRNSGMEVAGIQIINEAQWEAPSMYKLYDECLAVISAVDSSIPVIVSDAWNLDKAIDYAQSKNFLHQTASACPVVIDTHYYWAFSDEDKRKSPQEIIAEVQTKLSELDGREGDVSGRGAVQTIVGEYSCVLTEESWARSGGIPKGELVMQFGHEQSKRWQARSGGSFFWTWKMDWHPGGEWGFTAQTTNKAIMPPPMRTLSSEQIQKILETARRCEGEFCNQAFQQHVDYWKSTASAMWRYKEGWMRGYRDAMIFFEGRADDAISGANKIGNLEIWILKRLREFGDRSEFVWHFEHGLRRGIRDFYAILGE